MATKAEQARADAQRTGRSSAKKTAKKKSAKTLPRPTNRDTPRNDMKRAKAKKTDKAYAAEGTAAGARPSRKSTRRSEAHVKPDSQLKRRQTRQTSSPKARAERGK